MRASLTYGEFPSRNDFDTAFYEATKAHVGYEIRHGSTAKPYEERPDAGMYSAHEMWKELHRLSKFGSEESLTWCSDILGTLGFEWI